MKIDFKTGLVLLAVLLVASVGSAYLTTWVFGGKMGQPGADTERFQVQAAVESYNPDLVWEAGQFTVNLASSTPISRYVKTSISFRVNSKSAVNELEKRRTQVQDRVLTTLRMTQSSELQQDEELTALKQRLLDRINEILAPQGGRVLEVYVSELIIQ